MGIFLGTCHLQPRADKPGCMAEPHLHSGELIKILQRNRTSRRHIPKEIYYKELAHTIMEADKSQDLQSANQTHESRWHSSSPKTSRSETEEEPKLQFKSEGRKNKTEQNKKNGCPSPMAVRQEEFPLTLGKVNLSILFKPSTDWMRPTHIGEGSLLYLAPSNVSSENTFTDSHKIIFGQISGHLVAQIET